MMNALINVLVMLLGYLAVLGLGIFMALMLLAWILVCVESAREHFRRRRKIKLLKRVDKLTKEEIIRLSTDALISVGVPTLMTLEDIKDLTTKK